MCTTNFHFITYNTHLFYSGLPISVGALFEDGPRKTVIDQTYLEKIEPYKESGVVQIAALQEVWDAKLAGDIARDVDSSHHGSFNNRYAVNRTIGPNPPGLLLLADPVCSFHDEDWHAYKSPEVCGLTGWSDQDLPVEKGYLKVKCDFPCSKYPGKKHAIGLFTTHMPVEYGSYPTTVGCAFDALAAKIKNFQSEHQDLAAFLLGDLNIDYYRTSTIPNSDPPQTEYEVCVTGKLTGGGIGLHDAAAEMTVAGNDPGGTIRPSTNTLWQYFNKVVAPPFPDDQRIDYFLYANSPDGTMMVQFNNLTVKTDGLTITGGYNCSDHYPFEASVTVSVDE